MLETAKLVGILPVWDDETQALILTYYVSDGLEPPIRTFSPPNPSKAIQAHPKPSKPTCSLVALVVLWWWDLGRQVLLLMGMGGTHGLWKFQSEYFQQFCQVAWLCTASCGFSCLLKIQGRHVLLKLETSKT